jgi:hypothetical protein
MKPSWRLQLLNSSMLFGFDFNVAFTIIFRNIATMSALWQFIVMSSTGASSRRYVA